MRLPGGAHFLQREGAPPLRSLSGAPPAETSASDGVPAMERPRGSEAAGGGAATDGGEAAATGEPSSKAARRAESASSVGILAGENEAQQRGLQLEPRVAAGACQRQRLGKGPQRAHQHRLRDFARPFAGTGGVFGGQIARQQLRVDSGHQQIPQRDDQRADQHLQIGPRIAGLFDDGQRRRGIAAHARLKQRVGELPSGSPEGQIKRRRGRRSAAGKGRNLLEHGEGVAQTAVGAIGDRGQRLVIDGDPFAFGDLAQFLDDHRHRNAAERIALAAREDRDRKLVRLGRREDKNRMRRRLFERFEKGVRAFFGEHVRFVDDVDFHPHRCRRELYRFAQGADLVDSAIARRVDLQDVERRAGQHGPAIVAGVVGFGRRSIDAVDASCEDFRSGGLAGAAGTRE